MQLARAKSRVKDVLSTGLFVYWTVRLLDCSSTGLFVYWTVRLLDGSSTGLFVYYLVRFSRHISALKTFRHQKYDEKSYEQPGEDVSSSGLFVYWTIRLLYDRIFDHEDFSSLKSYETSRRKVFE